MESASEGRQDVSCCRADIGRARISAAPLVVACESAHDGPARHLAQISARAHTYARSLACVCAPI